jgi:ribosome-binding factor A
VGNRNHRSGQGRRGASTAPPWLDPDFAAALSGGRSGGATSREDRKDGRKTRQLCRQVFQAVSLALGGECGDDLLRDVIVESVEPAPNASRLAVRVYVPARVDLADVLDRLARVTPHLRRLTARAITRKRAPELTFVPTVQTFGTGEEVADE